MNTSNNTIAGGPSESVAEWSRRAPPAGPRSSASTSACDNETASLIVADLHHRMLTDARRNPICARNVKDAIPRAAYDFVNEVNGRVELPSLENKAPSRTPPGVRRFRFGEGWNHPRRWLDLMAQENFTFLMETIESWNCAT